MSGETKGNTTGNTNGESSKHEGENAGVPRRVGILPLVKAVAWSFFGVRKRADLEADVTQLHPLALIAAGLIGAALFIGVLLLVVHVVVR